jgi:hypothetical protein
MVGVVGCLWAPPGSSHHENEFRTDSGPTAKRRLRWVPYRFPTTFKVVYDERPCHSSDPQGLCRKLPYFKQHRSWTFPELHIGARVARSRCFNRQAATGGRRADLDGSLQIRRP